MTPLLFFNENNMKKILIVFGTRPEAIKLAPIIRLLSDNSNLKPIICVTAQHREMLDQVLNIFNIKPDIDLNLMKDKQTLFSLTSSILTSMKEILDDVKPDLVLVHGDTTTTFAVSLACFYSRIPIGHVEAGLRTHNKQSPYPEEANRVLTTHLSDLHFTPTLLARQNLILEGIPQKNIHIVGNTAIDSLFWMKDNLPEKEEYIDNYLLNSDKQIVLITAHRRESFGEPFESICLALKELSNKFKDHLFIYPVHLNPSVQEPVRKHLSNIDNFHLINPLPYSSFIRLMELSKLIITDSGGIQEEAPSLGKPVLVLREVTERPEAVTAGTVFIVGTDKDKIISKTSEFLSGNIKTNAINPYGDGKSSERIVDVILKYFNFNPIYNIPPLDRDQIF